MKKADIIRLLDMVPDDEPLFLLRGSDRVSPGLMKYYAGASEARGAPAKDVSTARAVANAMDSYPKRR
jgi:hypothetical protein